MVNILLWGLVIALFVGLAVYFIFKTKGQDPKKGFAWGFFSTLALAVVGAAAYFFKKKKKF